MIRIQVFVVSSQIRLRNSNAATHACTATHLDIFYLVKVCIVKPVLSDHIEHIYFWVFRQVVAYCWTLSAILSFSNKQLPVYSEFDVTGWSLKTGLTIQLARMH